MSLERCIYYYITSKRINGRLTERSIRGSPCNTCHGHRKKCDLYYPIKIKDLYSINKTNLGGGR